MKQHGAALSVRAMLLKALVGQLNSSNLDLAQDLSSPFTMVTLQARPSTLASTQPGVCGG
jgi:nicotinate-nucleotide adenylyltransferase